MIQDITFPSDPENYVFMFAPRFASVYLLARAKQHYGSLDGLDIVCNMFVFESKFEQRRNQYNEINRLADSLGVPQLKFLTWEKLFPNGPKKADGTPDGGAIIDAYLNISRAVDVDAKRIDEGGYVDTKMACKELMVLRHANLIDENMLPTSGTPYKTIVAWHAHTSKPVEANPSVQQRTELYFMGDVLSKWSEVWSPSNNQPVVWAPIVEYTVDDVLQEAVKHDVIDVVLQANVCEGHWKFGRPLHCGVCRHCLIRRHTLIQSQIPDPTKYDLT
jgi:hypothetical protein